MLAMAASGNLEEMLRDKQQQYSGCWFQRFLIFIQIPGEMVQFDSYFPNGLKPPTSIPSPFSTIHYHAHHHSLAPSHHHPSAYTYEPPVSVIIHHHPSLSVIIYQD